MKTASYTLLPFIQFGSESINDGPYDGVSQEFNGDPVKAASYYLKGTGIQTVSWYLDGFAGGIEIEATLDEDPETANYFPVNLNQIGNIPEVEIMIEPPPVYPPVTENMVENIEGNFTWIRAKVFRFTAGSIIKVSLGY